MVDMSKHAEAEQKLERVLHQTLRELPLRKAPITLESRLVEELARRAALPWWRGSFVHWPVAARVAFVLLCAGLVAATILGGASAFIGVRSFSEVAAQLLSWAQPMLAVISSAGGLAALLLRVIPQAWVYGGLLFGILLYLALFGLGAAAYRTLYLPPSLAGDDL
jgi:hypothetical protein